MASATHAEMAALVRDLIPFCGSAADGWSSVTPFGRVRLAIPKWAHFPDPVTALIDEERRSSLWRRVSISRASISLP